MFSSRQLRYLNAMGIEAYELRPARDPDVSPALAPGICEPAAPTAVPASAPMPAPAVRPLDWEDLAVSVSGCTGCELHKGRNNTVFGTGDRQAQWLFVGEAPGAEEDRQGEPFVGQAGQLLNAMLLAIGLRREQVYIANVLKCRPPGNRDPRGEEVQRCEPFLLRQIELLQPKIIVAMGRFAAHSLLKTEEPLGRLRGQRLSYHGTPLVCTYHPAYLLRTPSDKRKAWEDLRLAKAVMGAL